MKKIVYSLLVLSFINTLCIDNQILQGVSFFSPRSQSTDAARNIVGWHPYIHRYDIKSCYATLSAAPEVTTSFHADRIAYALFGTDTLHISGSQIKRMQYGQHEKMW